jgi:hypothetical protein
MSRETLYTIVLDYKGGTYISQSPAESPEAALTKWANAIGENDLVNWGLSRAEITQLPEDSPVPLKGCLNVWCVTASTKEGLMLVNIVATEAA